jgi:CarD family transcriptional regulator
MTKRKSQPQAKDFTQLSVGDRVVHPIHGVGEIIEINHQELVEGFEHYCVIRIPGQRLTLHIPVNIIDKAGIRALMPQAELARVLDTLRGLPSPLPEEFVKRQDQIRKKLETGHPIRVAEAVRDLTWHEHQAYLTKADIDLLNWARELLTDEIAAVTSTDISSARQEIRTALKEVLPVTP